LLVSIVKAVCPENRSEPKGYVQRYMTKVKVADPQGIINIIDNLPEREYIYKHDECGKVSRKVRASEVLYVL
jgi:hypothetical protein